MFTDIYAKTRRDDNHVYCCGFAEASAIGVRINRTNSRVCAPREGIVGRTIDMSSVTFPSVLVHTVIRQGTIVHDDCTQVTLTRHDLYGIAHDQQAASAFTRASPCLVALVLPLASGAGLQAVLIRHGTKDQGTKGTLHAPFASNNASFVCHQGPRHGRNGRRGLSRAIGVGV